MGRNFTELAEAMFAAGRNSCVGLDPVWEKIPLEFRPDPMRSHLAHVRDFLVAVIEQTAPFAGFYKLNIAFFERFRGRGVDLYDEIISYIAEETSCSVIADMKRGDIGNTNEAYLDSIRETGADAVTLNPYFGYAEGLDKIIGADPDLGCFVLCRTSNAGGAELQNRLVVTEGDEIDFFQSQNWAQYTVDTRARDCVPVVPLYQLVAYQVSRDWNTNGNCGLVVGATYPLELSYVRQIVGPEMPILVPGIDKQGGDLEGSVRAAGSRSIINISSGIIFADDPAAAAKSYHEQIQAALAAA